MTAMPGDSDLEIIEFCGTEKSEFLAGSHHVLIENETRVWLSSDFGISCFNSRSGVVSQFTYLNSSIGNTPQPLMVLSEDRQRLWIAQNGYLEVLSMDTLNLAPSDSIRLTRLSLANGDLIEQMTSGSILELNHQQNSLELRFSNFNFTNARDSRYQYRFSHNSAWLPMKGNTLRFDNLGPSKYPLEVRAINSIGKISANVFNMQIIILPPFWKTWCFLSSWHWCSLP
ncbi:MAG: hypothetical protein IPN29_17690 [Saprospiraceae bacterium]|nr:hypothetical protein [Saprospiraceae bacterium]